ncbi:MAG: biotin-dependent carboxyltransferase family protein [Flavobacteriaceae bacterium]|jgi:biotin-dependent carboxylase-like uncharacterized protein
MIEIIHPGWYSSIQDQGRWDTLHLGVPIGGAMDHEAFQLANALLNNSKYDAVIEMTYFGAQLKFHQDTLICITGADMEPKLNGKKISNNKAIAVKEGDQLKFTHALNGCRTYLGVFGGIQTETLLGSKSQAKGITRSSKLTKNNILPIGTNSVKPSRFSHIAFNKKYDNFNDLNVYPGPEYDDLPLLSKQKIEQSKFTVSKDHDRMAFRLNEKIAPPSKSIWTSPVIPGTVQCTPDGTLLILMRDAQVTGGYPRILQLSDEALNCLAQKTTSNQIQFILSSVNDT